jgi:hypothetical protein
MTTSSAEAFEHGREVVRRRRDRAARELAEARERARQRDHQSAAKENARNALGASGYT